MSEALSIGAGISLAAALGAPAAAQATDFTVTTLGDPAADSCDPGDCSLREAVEEAEANATDDRILFQAGLTGTIALGNSQGRLFVDEPLEVLGPGAAALTVSADANSQIFYIDTAPADPVAISGLTLSGGDSAASGGAIRSLHAELTIRDSTISGNSSGSLAGGVFSYQGTTTIEGSTISGNNAYLGGGVYSAESTTTIEGSTISGNGASSRGGGFYSYSGTTTIEGSTISGNDAVNGGGISSFEGTITIEGSTIAGNEAASEGGGIYSRSSPTDPILTNTIVAANAAPTGPDLSPGPGSDEFDASFSLIGSTAGATVTETVAGSNITGQSAQLGPLAANGGSTQTMAPALTSPAVDRGMAPGPDQRGLTRPIDLPGIANSTAAGANGADIGAVELQLPSNAFTFGALKRKPKKGTAVLSVRVPGAGSLALKGAKVRRQAKNPQAAGVVRLLIRARGKAAKRLRRTGRARVRAKVTYTPTAGNPRTKSRMIRLVKRKRR